MHETEAIQSALEAYRRPQVARDLKRAPLPQGMLTLIKIVASSREELQKLVTETTADQLPLQDAGAFYLQQVLIHAKDDYRQLGLTPGATLQDVKEHKRWLLKWLHPDRNHNSWESGLFKRVADSAARLEGALRDGAQPASFKPVSHRRKSGRAGSWQVAQRRVKQTVGWRPRLLKVAVVVAALVLLLVAAQVLLSLLQGPVPGVATSRLVVGFDTRGET